MRIATAQHRESKRGPPLDKTLGTICGGNSAGPPGKPIGGSTALGRLLQAAYSWQATDGCL